MRIMGPMDVGPTSGPWSGGPLTGAALRERLNRLLDGLLGASDLLHALGHALRADVRSVQTFLREGYAAFRPLADAHGLWEGPARAGDVPPYLLLASTQEASGSPSAPPAPPRREGLLEKIKDFIESITKPIRDFAKTIEEYIKELGKAIYEAENPNAPARQAFRPGVGDPRSSLQDMLGELGRLTGLGFAGPAPTRRPGDIDPTGLFLASAPAATVSDVALTPPSLELTAPATGPSVGEQLYGKAKDWSGRKVEALPYFGAHRWAPFWRNMDTMPNGPNLQFWSHFHNNPINYPRPPANWEKGHVGTAHQVIAELAPHSLPASEDRIPGLNERRKLVASKAQEVLRNLLPWPIGDTLTPQDILDSFRKLLALSPIVNPYKPGSPNPHSAHGTKEFNNLSNLYKDVTRIHELIQEFRKRGITDPRELASLIKNELVGPSNTGEARERLIRAFTVYVLASGDEGLTGVPRR